VKESIGVVIPTFERVQSTVDAIESVLSQTLKVDEIVVVDDGSDISIFQELKKKVESKPINLIRMEPSRHPGRARNAGVSLLNTKWVAFLDSDDVWHKDKMEKQLNSALTTGAMALCSNAQSNRNGFISDYKLKGVPASISLGKLLRGNMIINSSVLIDRSLLISVGGVASSYSVRGVEDYATWLRIATKTEWKYIDEDLLTYTEDSGDSIRGTEEFIQNYSSMNAYIDFASWLDNTKGKRNQAIRLVSKIYPYLLHV
jgi:glycosyltransferase involved in cell wall biosynthesis